MISIIQNKDCFRQFNFLEMIRFADLHDILPLVFYNLKNQNISFDIEVQNYLKDSYLSNLKRNLIFWRQFLNINDVFLKRNITIVPIKGLDILIRFYPFFDLRSMCDIDILIKEEDFLQAQRVLSELGYQKKLYGHKEEYWRRKQCHIAFVKDSVMVELHWSLDFKRRSNKNLLPHLWQRLKEYTIQNHKIKLLSAEDAVFCFALHWRHLGNVLSLKQVLDVARIIKETPDFDWDYMLKEARRGKANATLYFILTQVDLFTETKIPPYVFQNLNLPRWQKDLIKKFLLKYTFKTDLPLKQIYLKAHFLLYDNLIEPFLYIVNIPYEQFCKFYNLKFYTLKSDILYAVRFAYMPFKQIVDFVYKLKG